MANVIKLKNSGTANSAPTSLETGELAINYADGKLFYKNSSNTIVEFSSSIPSGGAEGQMLVKATDADYDLEWIDNYTGDLRIVVKNDSGVTISKGQAVMAVGSVGDRIRVAKAVADGSVGSNYMLGVASENISDATEGYINLLGEIRNLNTNTYSVGTVLYIDPNTPGDLTSTQPTAPGLKQSIAIVTRQHVSTGIIFVRMWLQDSRIADLSDVNFTSLTADQFLKWNGSVWVNATIPDSGGGVTVSETPPASPTAGDLWFESDTGKTFVYYDSFWVESSGADGSQGSTGNTGPEGGSTTLTTKGDILARNSSEIVRLPVGTDGKVLTANSSTAIGLEWVTPTVYATVANLSTLSNTVTDISDNTSTLSNTVTTLSANVSTLSNTVTLKANIASPAFTGVPTAPTAANTVSNTQIATTAYVKTVIGDLVNSAPAALDTLGEIATSLANNASLSSTLTTSIALKAPLADPTFTGTVSGITKSMVGLGSVDNTTDLGKPISNATQTALDLKAPLANATFTGTIVLPATTSIANVTSTEIGYLDGVTSAIQTQIDSKLSTSSAETLYEKLIPYSNTAPTSPSTGDLWVDSTIPTVKAYNGSAWIALGSVADDDQPILAARIFS
jgi:hypothetical protein